MVLVRGQPKCSAETSFPNLPCSSGRNEPPPVEEALAFLRTWDKVDRSQLLAVFAAGNFAGIEEMRRNERLLERVAPLGVNDIAMAVQYK